MSGVVQFDGNEIQPINVTEAAIGKVSNLLEEEGDDSLFLRVFVTGGGCSGFQYGFTFDTEAADDDTEIKQGKVRVLVDSLSFPYISGATLDYQEGLEGAKFVVTNPQADSTCGCGSSFSV